MKLKDWGERRWYVNGQGQTFAVIEGPVEFRMGSPPTEPERNGTDGNPTPHGHPPPFRHRRQGGHRRAVAAVLSGPTPSSDCHRASSTVQPRPGRSHGSASTGTSPPHYCNWLSEQEGLPKDQWCYLPNEAGAYAEGMSIPADVSSARVIACPPRRNGNTPAGPVRSPADITVTRSTCLTLMLGIRPTARSMPGRAGACCPTTWGCSTCWGTSMNGARIDWNAYRQEQKGNEFDDSVNIEESIEKEPPSAAGRAFNNPPGVVRSADRGWNAPAFRITVLGFRPSRTGP